MQTEFLDSLEDIAANEWDALWATDYPFVRHAYLYALEASGCTTARSGWQPHHLVVRDQGRLVAAMPLYIKDHSYGEYVFDWSWADAYQRYGRDYYPKLLNAIPFTPATGPRWAAAPHQAAALLELMHAAIGDELERRALSSFHCLFPNATQLAALKELDAEHLLLRSGCQFHWFNDNFKDFDDFLDRFTSRKRKAVNRERRKVQEQSLSVEVVLGESLSAADWQTFFSLYRLTYLKRSGHDGYLNAEFFQQLGQTLASNIMMVKAFNEGRWVAAALYFFDAAQLYGRYWGALDEYDGLHFECCYYQGIEFAISRGLYRFDPGAQGEHKIQRGFAPIYTASLHWIGDPPFAEAIGAFLLQERQHMAKYCADARTYLPFKEDAGVIDARILVGSAIDY